MKHIPFQNDKLHERSVPPTFPQTGFVRLMLVFTRN